MKHAWLPVVVLVSALSHIGCGSSGSNTGSTTGAVADPIPAPAQSYDATLVAFANGATERDVLGDFGASISSLETNIVTTQVAGCTVTTEDEANPAVSSTAAIVDAGTITASSTSLGSDVALPISAGYGRIVQPGAWPAGETVTFTGTGGADISAFTKSVVVPSFDAFDVQGCGSATSEAAPCVLGSGDVIVTWSQASGDVLEVDFDSNADFRTGKMGATCFFPAAAGSGRIPAAVIERLNTNTNYPSGAPSADKQFTVVAWLYGAPTVVNGPGSRTLAVSSQRLPPLAPVVGLP